MTNRTLAARVALGRIASDNPGARPRRRIEGPVLALLVGFASLFPAQKSAAQPDEATRVLAGEHFDRGIAFFNEGRFDAALAELARAYELAPAHQVLYNLARVHAALGQSVEAAETYRRYLVEADAIAPRRRREAQAALQEQEARIGRLMVETDVTGSVVTIDGVDRATTPLREAIALSAGSHNVEVSAPRHETVRRAVMIAGRSESQLQLTLREAVTRRGTVRVETELADVTIEVDGEAVGTTPLESTLALSPGEHTVSARRAGYQTVNRHIAVTEGAETEVRFELERAADPRPTELGRIELRLPDAPFQLHIDNEPHPDGGGAIELPIGSHRITLEVSDRAPYEGTFVVPAGTTIVINPPLNWSLDARNARVQAAEQQRTAGAASTIVGAVVTIGAIAVLGWNETEIIATDARVIASNREYDECVELGLPCLALERERQQLTAAQETQNVLRGVSIGLMAAGALATAIGLAIWVSAPSEEAVDSSASAALRVGPTGVELSGRF